MSRLSATHNGITEGRFRNLPALGGSIPSVTQARASDDISTTTRSSQKPTQLVPRTEGCFVTGFTDLSNDFAHFVSAVRAKERQPEKDKIISLLIETLRVIPTNALTAPAGFTLEHPSNMAWLSTVLHNHHHNWATIAISPCLTDIIALTQWYSNDNARRQIWCDQRGSDPGRTVPDIWLNTLPLENTFQLTVLHPKHFHPHPEQCIHVLGSDGHSKPYRASPDGVLKDEYGVPLPPFTLPSQNIFIRLNPILINFAAALRFRRLKRMDPALMTSFSADTLAIIDASLKLYAAVMWTPVLPKREEGSAIRVGTQLARASQNPSADNGDIEMGAGPSGTLNETPDSDEPNIASLFDTLGPEEAMDVLLGGYDFEPLPDLINDAENGGTSPTRRTTPPDDEERWDVIPAEVSGTDLPIAPNRT
ncbi:hypothetical protein FB451DRAFT_130601 [Mycena latifolia]|nr:hypothetical protein FB451DRAFT_130601 [Mycena latifolia]